MENRNTDVLVVAEMEDCNKDEKTSCRDVRLQQRMECSFPQAQTILRGGKQGSLVL